MKILRKLISWKKQNKEIIIVTANFPDGRTSYKIIAIHPFSKTIDLISNNKEIAEEISLNIKSISMTIEKKSGHESGEIIIWI